MERRHNVLTTMLLSKVQQKYTKPILNLKIAVKFDTVFDTFMIKCHSDLNWSVFSSSLCLKKSSLKHFLQNTNVLTVLSQVTVSTANK